MGNNLGDYNNLRLICEDSIEASIASKVFHDALLNNAEGVSYKPLLFATQVVNGINYKFIALGTVIVPNLPNDLYKITVHVSTDGKIEDKKIEKLDV